MAAHEAQVGGSECTGGFDELALLDGHDLGADEPGVADPAGDGQGEDNVEQTRPHEGDEGNSEQDSRQGEEGIGDVDVEDGVGPASVEAGERAGDQSQHEGESDDTDGDSEGDAGSVKGAGEDVAAEFVGAEPVSGAGRHEASGEVELGGVVRGKPGSKEGTGCEEKKQSYANRGEGLLPDSQERLNATVRMHSNSMT